MSRLGKWLRQLRPEECLALLAVLPFIALSWRANSPPTLYHLKAICYFVPLVLIAAVTWRGEYPTRTTVRIIRDFLPFVFIVWMYENMQDVTAVLHLADKHQWLIAADEWLCGGVNPVVWMQRLVRPWLTEVLVAAYMSYFLWPPLLTLVLYRRGQMQDFHDVLLAVVLAFYFGLIGYVIIPALDPWFTMRERFTVDLLGSPFTQQALDLLTISRLKVARDCFPSLHAAVSLVVLEFARRAGRMWFWVMLPVVPLLLWATVYLRVHYVVDLIAAVPLATFSVWAAPPINRWWGRSQAKVSSV